MSDRGLFGGWLKRCRQERGLTQDDLAERVGCATQTIRKIEGGQRRPSFQMAERLAQILQFASDEHAAWMRAARADAEPSDLEHAPALADTPIRNSVATLPTYLTPFVGREREQAELLGLLAAPSCRLITLLGPGGIGKTRLAVEVAHQVTGFNNGVAFVSLAPVASPAAIVAALGDALGFTFSGPSELLVQLLGELCDKQALVVIDNLEHLLDADGVTLRLIDRILTHAPAVKLLVTSRERLKLPSAWVLEVEGLPVLPADAPHRKEEYPALLLFAEHAQRVERSFHLTAQNERAVATICRLMGGMPLGIELAAAWTRLLSLDEIAEELARNLDAQHLSPGTLPTRHHSLRAVVDHSWHLLSETEREVLGQLAVFGGGFDRAAASAVAGAHLAVLASLADKSLLRRVPGGRFDLHEIIRQYAASRLASNAAIHAATHYRHAAYYANWLAEREPALKGAAQAATLVVISAEIDNIRAMWHWSVAHQRLDLLCRASETLEWFFEFRSWYTEGAASFTEAVEAIRPTIDQTADAVQRHGFGQLLGHYSFMASRIGAVEQGSAAAAQSHALLVDCPDILVRARTDLYQGMLAFATGDYALAHEALATGLQRAKHIDSWTVGFGEVWSTSLFQATGDYAEAEKLFRSALARYRALGNQRCIVFAIAFSGAETLITLGKLTEVQALLRESLALASAAHDRLGMAIALQQLGLVAFEQHAYGEAVYLFHEAVSLMRVIGNRWDMARALNQYGTALLANDAYADAEQIFRETLALALEVQLAPDALQALAGMATLFERQGRYAEALRVTTRVLADPTSRSETRVQMTQLHAVLCAYVPSAQCEQIAQHAPELPLATLLEVAYGS